MRTSPTDFSYYQLGTHIPPRGGRKPYPLARFVAAPDIGLPMAIDPKKGEHMYCNTQYYNLGGGGTPKGPDVPKVGVDSPENFYFPWTSNFCEKRGRSGDLACGTQYQEHMGQDCRPPKPTSRPTYDAAAVEDGTISGLSSDHIIKLESDRFVWSYLHLSRDRGLKKGDVVKKGDPIGKVWRNWGGKGTSLHLHIEGRFKDRGTYRVFDPLPSMIAAYQRALGNPYTVDDAGNLAYDAKFERTPGSAPPAIDPAKPPVVPPPATTSRPCEAALAEPPIGTEATYKFDSLWCHNGSVIGLASEGQSRALVYFKPKASVRTSATRDPVLVVARATEGQWSGTALHYSLACGDRRYPVAGTLGADGGRIEVSGFRDSFQSRDCSSVKVPESLAFTKIDAAPPAAPGAPVALPAPGATPPVAGQPSVGAGSPAPASSGGVAGGCPFALKPGEKPVGTGAAQRPPKSERTCNFNALTIPGGATLAQMPRYVREWPGLDPAGFLGDKFGDRIIAFNSAESGLGAWWYWIVKRAKHGP
ncbi:MAG: M23 family metallopeptidase, partial [Hyphomicrobiaceae bacterium]|nr:M23 family metallopeptidase [Hyphomicrobiaceae bacterium]